MRKLIPILLVLLLLTGCGSTPHSFEYEKTETVTLSINEEDVQCVGVFGSYTNDSSESACAADWISVKAYQNGVELSPIVPADEKTEGYLQCDKYIQSGKTEKVVYLFTLEDSSEVSVEIDGKKVE